MYYIVLYRDVWTVDGWPWRYVAEMGAKFVRNTTL